MGASCDKLETPNEAPRTFFHTGGAPPETLVVDNFMFRWFGVDLHSDVDSYHYRLLIETPCDPLPMEELVGWTATEDPRVLMDFSNVADRPDGEYVFQARTVDEHGATDEIPLTSCFSVIIQQTPVCSLTQVPPPRQGLLEAQYGWNAYKTDRAGNVIEGTRFEYSWQFSRLDPNPALLHPWSPWGPRKETTVTGLQGRVIYLFQVKARDPMQPENVSRMTDHSRHEFHN